MMMFCFQSTSWGRGQTQSKGERFGRKFIELVQTDPPIKQWKRHLDAAETTFSPLLQDLKLYRNVFFLFAFIKLESIL